MKKSEEQHQVARSVIGRADKRVEDARLVKGAGRFTSDIKQPNALHVTFIRSTIAYGKIERVDLMAALDRNGVVAAFSGRDVSQLGNLSVAKPLSHTNAPVFPILADDYVHAVGQPVAAVISQTPHQGLDASELFEVAITEEDAETADDSFYTAASQHWQAGDTLGAFDAAAFIVEVECQHPRLSPCPLEPRAITAKYDNGNLVVWLSTQTPHRARSELSSILNIDAARIRVIAPDVGGAFGMKASLYPEDVFVCWAALQLERTLTWTATRSEDFLAATHGRGSNSKGRLALDADGHFLALEADIKAPLGHWMPTSAAIPAWNAARILPGPYAVKNVDIKTSATLSPTAAVGIYRGAGRPEAAMLMERLVEKAAATSGVSAQDIRTKNFHCSTQFPVIKPTGNILDSGTYEHALTTLCASAAYQQIRSRRDQLRSAGECAGVGMAFFVEPSGRGWESAQVTLHKNGTVTAATGSSTQG
ncbi:MAG: xanthine dehydrogenase family protein molybdopterin-binding subunit, partial [Hyphomicrobiales bacterium]